MAFYGYEIKVLNATRVRVLYDGELICKFDRTEEDLQEMVTSILDWALEDGSIKSHARKAVKPAILAEVMEKFSI